MNSSKSVLQIESAFIDSGGFLPLALGANPNDDFLIKKQNLQQLMLDIISPLVFSTHPQPQAADISDMASLTSYLCSILKSDPTCNKNDFISVQNAYPVVTSTGSASTLVGNIDMLQLISPPQWNSKYPTKRKSKVRFRLRQATSLSTTFRDKNISFIVNPVNDPPSINAPSNYTVQEDRPNPLISPYPVAIIDDADDVDGSVVDVVLQVSYCEY